MTSGLFSTAGAQAPALMMLLRLRLCGRGDTELGGFTVQASRVINLEPTG